VSKSGSQPAANVILKMTLPPGAEPCDPTAITYDAASRVAQWNLNTLSSGTNVTPCIQTNAPIGAQMTFDLTLSTTDVESTYSDNVAEVTLPVVARIPSKSILMPTDRNYLFADGNDAITLKLSTYDQTSLAMPNVHVNFMADQTGVTLDP